MVAKNWLTKKAANKLLTALLLFLAKVWIASWLCNRFYLVSVRLAVDSLLRVYQLAKFVFSSKPVHGLFCDSESFGYLFGC